MSVYYIPVTAETHARFVECQDALNIGSDEAVKRLLGRAADLDSPAAAPCPKCDRRGNMQWQWKPDGEPTRERLRCYACGWDTGWIRYGTCSVTYR